MTIKHLSSLLILALLAACQSIGSNNDRPAVYTSHTESSFAELQSTVSKAIGADVGLASDALTNSSTLTIGRAQPGTMQNPLPQGRIVGMPFQFKLRSDGKDCYLVDVRTDVRYKLQEASCRPE